MRLMSIAGALAGLLVPIGLLAAPGVPVTYQGRLTDSGAPANGRYELRFGVFSSETGGVELAVETNLVTATNGLFTTTLDLDRDLFPDPDEGGLRWLEIGVRTNGSAADFTILDARQPLDFAPYAVRAAVATVAETFPASSVTASNLQSGTITADKIGSGEVVKSLNALHDDVTLAAGANAVITPSGNTLTLSGPTDWHLGGNSGATPDADFVGTLDDQPLELRVNNTRAYRFQPGPGTPNLIGGSASNSVDAGAKGATIAGGGISAYPNSISADYGTIGGGSFGAVSGPWGTIAGGRDNRVHSESATVGGGWANIIETNSNYAAISGGWRNRVESNSFDAFIGGGIGNDIGTNSGASTITAGSGNGIGATSYYSVIAGGVANQIQTNTSHSAIGGGIGNTILNDALNALIGGGSYNTNNGDGGTISGGYNNFIHARWSTIGGGINNDAASDASTIAGGNHNSVASFDSSVGGGANNAALGLGSTVPGGHYNTAAGDFSFAAGRYAQASHQGAFVWADSQNATFGSTTNDEFSIRAQNGVRVQSEKGIHLTARDRPIIVRDWDVFATNAPGYKAGIGRWGLFMEPFNLTLGIPSNDIPDRYFQVAKYNTNGNYTTLMRVNQSGDIAAAGTVTAAKLAYSAPRTHYCSVAGDLFVPRRLDSSIGYSSADGLGGACMTAGTENFMHAPLNLPDGAVITSLHAYFYDGSTQDLTVRILRYEPGNPYEEVASVSSGGISGTGDAAVAVSGVSATVQNDAFFYTIEAYSSGTWSTAGLSLKIQGVIVGYTISEAE